MRRAEQHFSHNGRTNWGMSDRTLRVDPDGKVWEGLRQSAQNGSGDDGFDSGQFRALSHPSLQTSASPELTGAQAMDLVVEDETLELELTAEDILAMAVTLRSQGMVPAGNRAFNMSLQLDQEN